MGVILVSDNYRGINYSYFSEVNVLTKNNSNVKNAFKGVGLFILGMLSAIALGIALLSDRPMKFVFAPPLIWATYVSFNRFYQMISLWDR